MTSWEAAVQKGRAQCKQVEAKVGCEDFHNKKSMQVTIIHFTYNDQVVIDRITTSLVSRESHMTSFDANMQW